MRNGKVRNNKAARNKTYERNHHNSIKALFELVCPGYGHVTWRAISKLAGISRQSLYKHFSDIDHIYRQGIDDILSEFDADFEKQAWKFSRMSSDINKCVLYMLFVFLNQQKDIFNLICGDLDHQSLLYQIIEDAFGRFDLKWLPLGSPAPDIKSEKIGICIRMLMGVVSQWGIDTGCDIEKADSYIDHAVRIVKAAEMNALP